MTGQTSAFGGSATELLNLTLTWQGGEISRDALLRALKGLREDQGEVVVALIHELVYRFDRRARTGGVKPAEDADGWREELLACRARTWPSPDQAGLLVGPSVILLVDGTRAVVLRDSGVRVLPMSLAASLLLLCQTIVMAEHAVNAKELSALQQQRIESTSTSLSEIEVVR